jgi:putative sigma-54 modulation protein
MTSQTRYSVDESAQTPNYNITLVGRHVDITEAMKRHAIDKVSKIDKFSDRIIDVTIRMDIQKLEHRVDLMMKVDHVVIKSTAATDDMYVSIDQAVAKLQKQLIKYRKRIQQHNAKKLSVIDMRVNVVRASDEEEINDEIEEENAHSLLEKYKAPEIVKQKTLPLKTLNSFEAIMKMELSGDAFMVFRSEEDQKLKVIYRREDRNFGIIEIES